MGREDGGNIAKRRKTDKRTQSAQDLELLNKRVAELDAAIRYESFAELPLSSATAKGLEASHYKTLTDVQRTAVPLALQRHDVLGAAKTGSGKTLAFLIPVLENLFRNGWTEYDGLGALILSPTRELAIQIFEVLRRIGRFHTFSAGLVIGGKSLQEERDRLGRMDILVCTPGRMLQHMDQTAAFDVGNLQMLVLDEADRILDMGFQTTVDAIIEHLPRERQTMLFSATQTRRVSDLARLSLRDPKYVSVHEESASATPASLQQHYLSVALPDKMSTLWSFIRSNLKVKILVFFSSGKQVRYAFEAFRRMQPGIPLLHLHGRQKQSARLEVTTRFHSSHAACLFSTDIAARGLDFPAVDWVVQLDCPEDADTYIHRVGRTARYEHKGHAVLFLDPSEEGMLENLQKKRITVERINVRQKKQQDIQGQLQNMCFRDPELKYLGQKAFSSYARSVHLQKDKTVFKLDALPLEEFATSLGLPGAPRIKFAKGDEAKVAKNASRAYRNLSSDEDKPETKVRTRYDRMFERQNQDVLAGHYRQMINEEQTDDAGFLSVKRRLSDASEDGQQAHEERRSKRQEKLGRSKKKLAQTQPGGRKLLFDEDGRPHEVYEFEDEANFASRGPVDSQKAVYLDAEQTKLATADVEDKAVVKARRKEKKERRKAREKAEAGENQPTMVTLAPYEGLAEDAFGQEEEGKTSFDEPRKKWFQRDLPEDEVRVDANTDDLEELEALAAGVLDSHG